MKDDSFDCTLIAHLRIFLLFYRLLYCLILPENRLFFGIWKVVEIEEKGHYDDGSVQDWYYLISYSVEGGHPGMIIEHAYMDNPHDNAILKDEAQLKAMGTADADAIASYYNLQIKTKTEN